VFHRAPACASMHCAILTWYFMSVRHVVALCNAHSNFLQHLAHHCSLCAQSALQNSDGKTLNGALNTRSRKKTCVFRTTPLFASELIIPYEIVFGLVDRNLHNFVLCSFDKVRRGHGYKLFLPASHSSTRFNFFACLECIATCH